MNLDHLTVFDLVAQHGSLSRAAKAGHTAQSLLSRKLALLEEEWGDRLFHRTGRGVVLTDFGRRLQPHVRALLEQTARLQDEVANASGVPTGVVRIGMLPSLAYDLVPPLFSDIQVTAPQVQLRITEGLSAQLDEELASGQINAAVINRYSELLNNGEEFLGQADSYLIGKPGLPLLSGKTISFRDLHNLPLVISASPTGLRGVLEHNARQKSIHLNVVLEVDSMASMRSVCMSGAAYTVLQYLSVHREIAEGKLQAVRIVDPVITRTIALSVTRQHPLTRAGRMVVSRLRELVPALLERGAAEAREHESL